MQALGARFKIWSDGAITPIAEEIPELRRLNETDLEDRAGRLSILSDPDYIRDFKAMWLKGKHRWGISRLKRKLNIEDYAFNRKLADMTVELCPQQTWQGMDFQSVFDRVVAITNDCLNEELSNTEQQLINSDFSQVKDEADFMLQMLRSFDTDLSWSTITANRDLKTVRELLMDPLLLPGFNDSGAHLTNMAFYDGNLRSLQMAATGGDADLSYMVKRLTKDAAEVFGVEGGTIYPGDVADLILIDPVQLATYNGEQSVARVYREEFQAQQLVNRSDGVVNLVMIGGQTAYENNAFSSTLGVQPMGRLLRSVATAAGG
jgi:N-acyl-D-aspartate/D-glutamate deacylase